MCQEYKKIKDNHNLTGHGIQWKYYNKLLGSRPATRPCISLEALESQPNGPFSDEIDNCNNYSSTSVVDAGISDNLDGRDGWCNRNTYSVQYELSIE